MEWSKNIRKSVPTEFLLYKLKNTFLEFQTLVLLCTFNIKAGKIKGKKKKTPQDKTSQNFYINNIVWSRIVTSSANTLIRVIKLFWKCAKKISSKNPTLSLETIDLLQVPRNEALLALTMSQSMLLKTDAGTFKHLQLGQRGQGPCCIELINICAIEMF